MQSEAMIFYDGHCGLCHGFVRFVLARDPAGTFRFAPLESGAFRARVPAAATLPDSVVVQLGNSPDLLLKSDAVRVVLGRLGRGWRVLGAALSLIPRPVRDLGYDAVARVRRRLFAPPPEACPIVPPHLRSRFEL